MVEKIAPDQRVEIGNYLVSDPKICGGQLTFKGTRVRVCTIFNAFRRGDSIEDILEGWPTLTREAVEEALHLAADGLLQHHLPTELEPVP